MIQLVGALIDISGEIHEDNVLRLVSTYLLKMKVRKKHQPLT